MSVGDQHHTPAALPLRNSFGTHFTWGWVGPRSGLDEYGEEKNSCPSLSGNSEPSNPETVAKLHTISPVRIDLDPFKVYLFQLFYSQHPLPDDWFLFSFLCLTQHISSSLFFAFGLYIMSISSPIFLHNSVLSLHSPPSFVLLSKQNASGLSVPHIRGHNIPTLFQKSHLLFNVPFTKQKLLKGQHLYQERTKNIQPHISYTYIPQKV